MSEDKPNNPIAYRPPKDKRAQIDAMKEQSGLSWSAFITACILRLNAAERQQLGKLLARGGAISEQLNDIELTGAENAALLLEQCRDELRMIRNAIMTRLGRRS